MGAEGAATVRFDVIRPWVRISQSDQLEKNWLALIGVTVVKLKPEASLEAVRAKLPSFLERRLPPAQSGAASLFIDAFPIGKMRTLGLENTLSPGPDGKFSAVALVLGLGLLALAVACVNYANLATAQAITRAREVGMRKTLGARRIGIMAQVWGETTLLSVAALACALIFLAFASSWTRAHLGIDPLYVWSSGPAAIASVAGIVALTAFLAGAYPAFRLSAARPADALHAGRSSSGSQVVSQVLVVVQFVSASFLLIMVTVMQLQRADTERTALAPHSDPIAVLNPLAPLGVDYQTLQDRLLQSPAIRSVAVTNLRPWGYGTQAVTLSRSADPSAQALAIDYKDIDYGYFDTLSLKTVAGRVFNRSRDTLPATLYSAPSTQTPPVVIDRQAAIRLGFSSPQEAVGKIVYVPESLRKSAGLAALPLTIIGVTENETSALEASDVVGHVYTFAPTASRGAQIPLVKFDRANLSTAIAHTRRVWDELAPNIPLNLQFYDDLFEQRYVTYAQASGMFMLFAGAAFIIATTGLLGIAVHVAGRRRHEIAVRKTLGSSVLGIIRLLLTDFSVPVLVGNLLAWPLGYLAAQTYLAAFAQRIDLTPAPFLLSLLITFVIAWAAVIGVILKAASVRPAEVLRQA
ncbi:MAG: FtsX-like permease family protein [Burkholderiales bacterium]|nr:MAG: FtsX-like permease family protein [Burkholderiales bacterium]